ncbi:hypothetical protein [Cellulosimicrobium cellulans]|uniref:hypothetical protein n=1 Tax=Cellulosimicrobium cellulans TaxID=1710 RepID=UPI00301B0776
MDVTVRSVRRLSVEIPGEFEDVVRRFEDLVPAVDEDALAAAARTREWSEVERWTQSVAADGFLRYWRNDVRPLMSVAGDQSAAIAYLMGNHVIVERMFRHEPRVMNYAPLRVELSQRPGEPVLFTVDAPSDIFGSFDNDALATVGVELDAKVGTLLARLGARDDVTAVLG